MHEPSHKTTMTTDRRVLENVTCLGCGCLCDDLRAWPEDNGRVATENACDRGRRWFDQTAQALAGPTTDLATALDAAARVLTQARAPVIFGLTRSVTETVCVALELAEVLGARVVLERDDAELGRVAAFQRQGRVSATLGEVKNRADLVIFWGGDPASSHPRHRERYSVDPTGRFVTGPRIIVVVGDKPDTTAAHTDCFFRVNARDDVSAFSVLRLLVQEKAVADPFRLEELAKLCRAARYGALFFQSRAARDDRSGADWEGAAKVVRDLNESTRFVLLGLGKPGNLTGAEAALTWQSGYLQGVDHRLGFPIPLDDLANLDDLLIARETDAVVVIGDAGLEGLSPAATARLATIPTIAIGASAVQRSDPAPTITIATAARV